ncbi:HAD family hydrolase [Clostridium baratii]|nr:HAD hydrolase family protein [Clostridium baratii]STA98734.1 cof family hydrolase [Clostridium baratii]
MYKLLALDLDGTLLRDDSTISDRTKNILVLQEIMELK